VEAFETMVGPLSLGQWALVVIGIIAAFSVINWLSRKGKAAAESKLTSASCLVCNWKGNVSKYHRTCPKCGNSITRLTRKEK